MAGLGARRYGAGCAPAAGGPGRLTAAVVLGLVVAVGGWGSGCRSQAAPESAPAAEWALAIHGGAGDIPKDISQEERTAYEHGLETALRAGTDVLREGGSALDAVERVVTTLEDDPHFNAARGAVFTADGSHQLDAAIMDGSDHACGAVAAVSTVKNPLHLARLVMEKTRYILLVGRGAEAFGAKMGVPLVEPSYFDTPKRREALERALERRSLGTVGAVARDRAGHLAAATSTGGLTAKPPGRVGDSPLVGAGTWADDATCAVSGTGTGEEFIRWAAAHEISARMALRGEPLASAAHEVVFDVLKPGDGGVIAVDHDGRIVQVFSTSGMLRGAADSSGRFEVKIWQ